jgi:hypothetical protein
MGADLVNLAEAARAFGITQATLRSRLDDGAVPEAVRGDDWALPVEALIAVAEREGWALDLTGDRDAATPGSRSGQVERYISETLAAHAAVVLAKTQATAARAQAQEMNRRLLRASEDLDVERSEREQATAALTAARAAEAELDKQRAVAEARMEEVRQQLAQERSQRSFLTQRIGVLERERDQLQASLSWIGRWRLRRSFTVRTPRSA